MRTSAGRDWMSRIMGDTASTATGTYTPANWIALTADVTAPNAASTTLTGVTLQHVVSGGLVGTPTGIPFASVTIAAVFTG